MLRIIYLKSKPIAFFLALVMAYAPIVNAATPSNGWTQGVSTTGQTVWFGPGTATKTSLGMGQAIWDSAVTRGGATFSATSKLAIGASEVAVVTKGAVTAASVFAAVKTIAGVASGPVMLGLSALSAYSIVNDYFTTSKTKLGGLDRRDSSQPFDVGKDVKTIQTLYQIADAPPSPSKETACSNYIDKLKGQYPSLEFSYYVAGNVCVNKNRNKGGIYWSGDEYPEFTATTTETTSLDWVPASWDDIRPYMDAPEKIVAPALIEKVLDYVPLPIVYPAEDGTYFPPGVLSVAGPSSVPGTPTSSVTETATKITTTTTTPQTDITYGSQKDPVTGKSVPTVTSKPGQKVVVTEKNKSTGVTTTISTTTTETSPPAAEPSDIETCGLPGKPKCLIDETGTPEAKTDTEYDQKLDDYQTKRQELLDLAKGDTDKPLFANWSSLFFAPPIVACSGYVLPRDMGTINPCPVVDGVRSIMAYIWALVGLLWSLKLVREVM